MHQRRVGSLLQLTLIGIAVLAARKQVRPHTVPSTMVREASLTTAPSSLPGGWLAQCGPYALLTLIAILVLGRWDTIPQRFVTHWNAQLEADGWAEKSLLSLLTPFLIGVTTCGLLTLISWLASRNTRRVHASGAAARLESDRRRATAETLLLASYLVAVIFALIGFSPLAQTAETARAFAATILSASLFGSLALILWVLFVIGPRYQASRRAIEVASDGSPIGDRTPDACWKLGVFYFNPADPSLFVEKRIGLGYTFNFARPAAWVFLATILAVPLLLLLLL